MISWESKKLLLNDSDQTIISQDSPPFMCSSGVIMSHCVLLMCWHKSQVAMCVNLDMLGLWNDFLYEFCLNLYWDKVEIWPDLFILVGSHHISFSTLKGFRLDKFSSFFKNFSEVAFLLIKVRPNSTSLNAYCANIFVLFLRIVCHSDKIFIFIHMFFWFWITYKKVDTRKRRKSWFKNSY